MPRTPRVQRTKLLPRTCLLRRCCLLHQCCLYRMILLVRCCFRVLSLLCAAVHVSVSHVPSFSFAQSPSDLPRFLPHLVRRYRYSHLLVSHPHCLCCTPFHSCLGAPLLFFSLLLPVCVLYSRVRMYRVLVSPSPSASVRYSTCCCMCAFLRRSLTPPLPRAAALPILPL